MALTAIILGMVFVLFSIVSDRMIDYKYQNQLVNDLNRLSYSFNKDIFDNKNMKIIDNEILFTGYTNDSIKYNYERDYILRNKGIFIDTFKIQLNKLTIDTLQNKSKTIVFQKLRLNVEVNNRELDLKFYKQVFVNELLQKMNKNEF